MFLVNAKATKQIAYSHGDLSYTRILVIDSLGDTQAAKNKLSLVRDVAFLFFKSDLYQLTAPESIFNRSNLGYMYAASD